jgi:hypothetical protein
MRAKYLEDGTIGVTGTKGKERFNRVWAGIGWPENEAGYLCVLGERADGRYHALWEKSGGLWELGAATVEAKDRFLIDCIWVDTRDGVATSYLRTLPGLCFHEEPPKERFTRPTGVDSRAKAWRSIADRTTATVRPASDRTTSNYRSALENARGVIMAGNLLIHEANCPKLLYALRQPLEDLLRSPVVKGLVWVLAALEHAKRSADVEVSTPDPWYSNAFR